MSAEYLQSREAAVRRWFEMWLKGSCEGLEELFCEDAVYIESWGPEYRGLARIAHWFLEWNTRDRVMRWDIRQFFHKEDQTVAEWYFRCEMSDGTVQSFDGLSLIRWDAEGRISFLQEFGCNEHRYDPYAEGPKPVFHSEQALWF